MGDSCEICGSRDDLKVISVKPSSFLPKIFSSTICGKCEKKYRTPYLRFFYANQTVAENMVREYKCRGKYRWVPDSKKRN